MDVAMAREVETGVIEREILISASPETIWELLVDPKQMTRWMGLEASVDLRTGGIYRVRVLSGHVASGRYVGILPMSVAQFNVGPGRLKISPVKLAPVHSAIGIITVRNRTLGPPAELFMKCARDFARLPKGMAAGKAGRPAYRIGAQEPRH